jgi:small subunit ribosomal protein S17
MNGEAPTGGTGARAQAGPGARKVREGVVVSDKMDKTVVVAVERLVRHPRYQKYRRQRARYKAHDQTNRCRVGDRVRIIETRPLSAQKRWAVVAVLGRNESLAEVVPA